MSLTYFKRFRMEIDLTGPLFIPPKLPSEYCLLAWDRSLLEAHAEAKYRSFRAEIEANVCPCLGEYDGCLRLMDEISHKDGFLAEATWLVSYQPPRQLTPDYCGTIQGICDRHGRAAVQNLGIAPEHRGLRIGSVLMHKALEGFCRLGLDRALLEVTAQNSGAIRLYQRMGFRKIRTVYKAAELAYS